MDDIADSGESLSAIANELKASFPFVEFKTAVLFCKKESCFKPEFFVKYTFNWIDFFWNIKKGNFDDFDDR